MPRGEGGGGSLSHRHTGAVLSRALRAWPSPGGLGLSSASSTPCGFRNCCPSVSPGLSGPQSLPLSPGGRRAPRVTGKCSVPGAEVPGTSQELHPEAGSAAGLAAAWGLFKPKLKVCRALGPELGVFGLCEGPGGQQGGGAHKYRCASGICNHLCFGFIVSPEGTLA